MRGSWRVVIHVAHDVPDSRRRLRAWAAKLRADRNIGDFRHWEDHKAYKKTFDRVVRDLTIKAAAP
jgi:hypothetical protein